MKKDEINSTNKLLEVIISLLLRQQNEKETLTQREQIKVLNDLNLKPVEISRILGKTNRYVSKEIHGLMVSKKTKRIK